MRHLFRRFLDDVNGVPLLLRLAATGTGALFILSDPSMIGGRWRPGSPVPALVALALFLVVGILGTAGGRLLPRRPRAEVIIVLELLLVGVLVRLTSPADSVFHLYFPLVLAWSVGGAGPGRGLLAGMIAAAISVGATFGYDRRGDVLSSVFLLPLFGVVAAGQRGDAFAAALRRLRRGLGASSRLSGFERTHSAVTAMAPLGLAARIERFLDEAVGLIAADAALVVLVDDDGTPGIRATRNLGLGEGQERWCHLEEGIAARVLREGRPVVTADASADPEWSSFFDGTAMGAAAAIPFRLQDRVIGLGVVGRRRAGRFRTSDLESLTVLAEETAVVVHDGRMQERLRDLLYSAVDTLAAALEAKDPYTRGHSQRVAVTAAAIATKLGLAPFEVEHVRLASLLHDVGKIATPESILGKRGPLSRAERIVINQHAERGAAILGRMQPFRPLVDLVLHHQECYDGTGYPAGLAGEEIPLGARIIRVADTFDALVSDRPYRHGRPVADAVAEVRQMAGSALDPQVVDAFLAVLEANPTVDRQRRTRRERS